MILKQVQNDIIAIMKKFLLPLLFLLFSQAFSQSSDIAAFTSEMQKQEGFFNYYYDEAVGRMFLEVDKLDKEFLYVNS